MLWDIFFNSPTIPGRFYTSEYFGCFIILNFLGLKCATKLPKQVQVERFQDIN